MPLRLVFMGTAELAAVNLAALLASSDFQIAGVVTQPDRPSGRNLKPTPGAVKNLALTHHIPLLQPIRARDASFLEQLKAWQPDLIVVAAYGQILPQTVLDLPRLGAINVHTSLLPKYRGAAPIQWAMLDGEIETGVTIMKMAAGLDTGDILSQSKTSILPEDTGASLHDRLAALGANLLVKSIGALARHELMPTPQDEFAATYARKITREDGKLNWAEPAKIIDLKVRALMPWPGTFTFLPGEEKPRLLKIHRATVSQQNSDQPGEIMQADKNGLVVSCGQGSLSLLEVQPEGGRRMGFAPFLIGNPIPLGTKLGSV